MRFPRLPIVIIVDLFLLYGVTLMYARGEAAFAMLTLMVAASGSWLMISKGRSNVHLVFPCLVMVAAFIVLPLLYTINIAFTNYSADHTLSCERARATLLGESWHPAGEYYRLKVFREGSGLRLMLLGSAVSEEHFLTGPVVNNDTRQKVPAFVSSHRPAGAELSPDEVSGKSTILANLVILLPDGTEVTMIAPGVFGTSIRSYRIAEDQSYPDQSLDLIDNRTGETLRADMTTGYFTRANNAEPVGPGFIIYSGWDNFVRVFTDPAIHNPLLKNFAWSVMFAAISVGLSLTIGLLLATLLHWEPLQEKKIYRVLLILPYAVPLFITALMFRGLFNQDSGEINLLLTRLFGSGLPWFSNASLAKTMVIMVNTWLSYPYMMILCSGLLTSVPDDLYEASAIDGASPVQNLVHITIPMIIKPLVPLLIACFAYDFNNLVLIAMLTDGAPHIPDSPVGATDVIAGYAYQTAFVSHDYGLAAAVATLIYVLTGVIAWLRQLATKRLQ